MPEFEPIVVLPAQRDEYARKPGGGSTPPPLVPVDDGLRSELAQQLGRVAEVAAQSVSGAAHGIPLMITVRERALAKSRRPYEFLGKVDLTPVASERRGEMISRATPLTTRALSQAIESRTSKADTYAISTFESFRVWDPIADAFGMPARAVDALLDQARESGIPLRVELFPWLTINSPWTDHRSTLADHLEQIGLPITSIAGGHSRTALYLHVNDEVSESSIRTLFGIRSAVLAPSYSAPGPIRQQGFRVVEQSLTVEIPMPGDGHDAAVGILDSGVSSAALEPWIKRRWTYDVGPELDPTHGTFVAGLVVASRSLNDESDLFPPDAAIIYDAQILPNGSISEDLLINRISEVLEEAGPTGPRVWNCSFNNPQHMDPVEYGTLSQELDLLSRQHGVLFVQAAGNYPDLRSWPPDASPGLEDGLATPAESVDSLTVGSLSHLGGLTPAGAVSSYSRRGPSFGGQQKPEVGFWSGDLDRTGQLRGYGIRSIGPGEVGLESVGTSFATPIVSGIAANVWRDLEAGRAVSDVTPALVKGLVIHSAHVEGMSIDDDHRPYYGAGVPRGESMALLDLPHTFTTIHEVVLRTGVNWEKRPFPMPECLFDEGGKLRAAVTLTLAYAPTIDAAFGDECVRTCVEPSFGRYAVKDGSEVFKGQMGQSHEWEKTLVERGKWSPVKTYRKIYKRGVAGQGDWALQLRLTAREGSIEPLEQRAFVIVTVESLEGALPVYQDGIAAINKLRYPSALAVDVGRLRLTNQV